MTILIYATGVMAAVALVFFIGVIAAEVCDEISWRYKRTMIDDPWDDELDQFSIETWREASARVSAWRDASVAFRKQNRGFRGSFRMARKANVQRLIDDAFRRRGLSSIRGHRAECPCLPCTHDRLAEQYDKDPESVDPVARFLIEDALRGGDKRVEN